MKSLYKIVFLLVTLIGLSGCGDENAFTGGDTPGEPDPGSVTLDAYTTLPLVTVGETTTISATLMNGDAPVASEPVNFRVDSGSFTGNAKYITVDTDGNGVATVTLTAPILVGTDTVTALYGDKSATVSLEYVHGPAATILLSASPSEVGLSGDSSLTVRLWDQYTNPIVGEVMKFTFQAQGSVTPTFEGSDVGVATTDSTGLATMVYTSGTVAGTDTIAVTPWNGGPSTTRDIDVVATATTIKSLTLRQEFPTTDMTVDTSQKLSATVLKDDGTGAENISVSFSVDNGTISNGTDPAGSLASAVTNANGVATVTLTAPKMVGTGNITAATAGLSSKVALTYKPGAPASIVLFADPAQLGVAESSTVTVKVYDQYTNLTPDQPLEYTVPVNNSNGYISPNVNGKGYGKTDASGVATFVYVAGDTAGVTDTVKVLATSGINPSETVLIGVNSGAVPKSAKMTIRTDTPTIQSDNSTQATITATLLDSVNAVVPNTTVYFASSGGQLSSGLVDTDSNGEAKVTLSAGTDIANQTITVTASSAGVTDALVPVAVVGTTVEITATRDVIITDGANTSELTIKVADASGVGVYNVPVTLGVDNGAYASLSPLNGTTDVNGEVTATLTGLSPGSVVVTADAIGAQGNHSFTVESSLASLLISAPASGTTAPIDVSKLVTVEIPSTIQTVSLVATLGLWDSNSSAVRTITNANYPANGATVNVGITSAEIGSATIRASDALNPSMSNEIQLIFVDETVTPTSTVVLQATPTTVPPSIGTSKNSSLLEISVKNGSGTGIANAMVTFSMSNTTGSGEYVYPAVVYTDSAGKATASFYSGSESSSAEGVIVTAALDETYTVSPVTDSVNITVNGTAGSISLSPSTKIYTEYQESMYYIPFTVLVTDSGSNPVPDTVVTLSVWPEMYGLGYWTCVPAGLWRVSELPNEDINRDVILDIGEDVSGNGGLTPVLSDAGSVPPPVTTDGNGVAEFNLRYPKTSAGFIYDVVKATALVQGTETNASYAFWLPASETDVDGCDLEPSKFNKHWIMLSAVADSDIVLVGGGSDITVSALNYDVTPYLGAVDVWATILTAGTDDGITAPSLDADFKTTDPLSGTVTFTYTSGGKAGVDEIMFYRQYNGEIVAYDYVTITAQ